MAHGSRVLGHADRNHFARELGIVFFNRLVSFITRTHVTDCSNGYRAVRTTVLPQLVLRQEQFHTSEFMIEAIKRGIPAKEVPITVEQRLHGHSKKPAVFRYGARLRQRDRQDLAAMTAGAARIVFLAIAAAAACLTPAAHAREATFRHGVIGARLSERVGEYAAWSPDGAWIAIPTRSGLRLRNVETKEVRNLPAPAFSRFPASSSPLDWRGDGTTIRYLTGTPPLSIGENPSRLIEVQADGLGVRQTTLGVQAWSTSWAAQGWPLVFETGPYAYDFDKGPLGPRALTLRRRRVRVRTSAHRIHPHPKGEEDITEPALSSDGTRVAFQRWGARRNVNIWTVGIDGSDPSRSSRD